MSTLLDIKALTKQIGGLTAVNNFDIFVNQGKIVGLIGPNGAGRTTLLDLINGIFPCTSNSISFDGKDITGKNAMAGVSLAQNGQVKNNI